MVLKPYEKFRKTLDCIEAEVNEKFGRLRSILTAADSENRCLAKEEREEARRLLTEIDFFGTALSEKWDRLHFRLKDGRIVCFECLQEYDAEALDLIADDTDSDPVFCTECQKRLT